MNSAKSGKSPWRHFTGIVIAIITLLLSHHGVPASAEASIPIGVLMPTDAVEAAQANTTALTTISEATDAFTPSYPEPVLLSPLPGSTIGKKATFLWKWDGTLQEGEKFDFRIGRAEKGCSCVALCNKPIYRLDGPLDNEEGQYSWQVAVVRIGKDNKATTLIESPIWSFVWEDRPSPQAVVVMEGGLNLRAGPGTIYDKVGSLRKGEALDIQGRIASNRWIKVVSVDQGIEGWVSALPEYVQINVDLTPIAVVEAPPTPTPMLTQIPTPTLIPTPLPTVLAPAPVLRYPVDKATAYKNRSDLSWEWAGTLGPDDYFQVEIRNRINVFYNFDETVPPIDRAWVKEKSYHYDVFQRNYPDEYKWRIIVVRGIPPGEKPWSTSKHRVWEPSSQLELISGSSEMRTLFVKDVDDPVSGGNGGNGDKKCHDQFGREVPCK
jgi:uncharacterized protein YgiM (DUF1202 family)